MREFVLYGMDGKGTILWTERLAADVSNAEIGRLARQRLEQFEMVEVCERHTRVVFVERPTHRP